MLMDIHCFVTTENRICIHLITLKVAYFAGYSVDAGGCGFRGIRHRLDHVFRDHLKAGKYRKKINSKSNIDGANDMLLSYVTSSIHPQVPNLFTEILTKVVATLDA